MRFVLKSKIPLRYSKDPKIQSLIDEKNLNLDFLQEMQEFQSKLVDSEFSIESKPVYNVTKIEYYNKCIELLDRIIDFIDRPDHPEQFNNNDPENLLNKYISMKDDYKIALDQIENIGNVLVDEDDYPANNSNLSTLTNLDFNQLLGKFSSMIDSYLDMAVLSKQLETIFYNSSFTSDKFNTKVSEKEEKRISNGYNSNFYIIETPFGKIECQVQSPYDYEEGNTGNSAHTKMKNKRILGPSIPDSNDPNLISTFKKKIFNMSPRFFVATIDSIEDNLVRIIGSTDLRNFKKILLQVEKGSRIEKSAYTYLDSIDKSEKENGTILIDQTNEQNIEISENNINSYVPQKSLEYEFTPNFPESH